MIGLIKWFSNSKGYGFITSTTNNKDYYFNVKDVIGSKLPQKGDIVEFEELNTIKGLRAQNIKIIEENPINLDDRIICPNCNKRIVPRIITYYGNLDKSVCPYCGITIKNFEYSEKEIFIIFIFFAIIISFILYGYSKL